VVFYGHGHQGLAGQSIPSDLAATVYSALVGIMRAYTVASWFETRGVAALLTMRI
jgi:hypothetical protein